MAEHNPGAMEQRLHLLVLRCQTGDERAFAQLLNEFSPRTLSYLRGMVGDAAEDIQQEVWLSVYRSIGRLAYPGAFRTWLFRIARHRALDFLRQQKRELQLIDDVAAGLAAVDEPASALGEKNLTDAMLDAVDTLGPLHREVCLLRYRDEMSYAEIGVIIGCSIGTVRSRLHYAKQQLHERIKHGR